MDYRSARELAKLPQRKQEQAYQLAQKMAKQYRKLSPSSRLVAKAVSLDEFNRKMKKLIQDCYELIQGCYDTVKED